MAEQDSVAALGKWSNPVLFSLLISSGSISETLFKIRALEILLSEPQLQMRGMSRESIVILVEGEAGLIPKRRVWELIESTHVLEGDGTSFHLRESIPVSDFYRAETRRPQRAWSSAKWTVDDLRSVFFSSEEVSWTVRTVRRAIYLGYNWFLWTLGPDDAGSPRFTVLPAFWKCESDGDIPLGSQRAVTSIGDTLGALVDSHQFACSMATVSDHPRAALEHGIAQLLMYVASAGPVETWSEKLREWSAGGFLPYDDQPEAVYPTVDATWDAVLTLTSLYDQYDDLVHRYGPLRVSKARIGQIVIEAIRFLLRMRLPDGGWGIYQFPGNEPPVAAHEFTTAQTILCLCLTLNTSIFEDQQAEGVRSEVERHLRECWEYFLQRRVVKGNDLMAWAPFFDDRADAHKMSELLRASTWTGTGLLALYGTFEDLRPHLKLYIDDVVELVDRYWETDYARIADVEFRVPLADRYDDTFKKWSNRLDVTVAIFLLGVYTGSFTGDAPQVRLSATLWERIERTIGSILKEQHPGHGHWHEPVAGLPLAAATGMAILTLQMYLIAVGHLVNVSDVAATEV